MNISPAIKGLITAALMIAVYLGILYLGKNLDPRFQYIMFAVYALGISWTIITYRQSGNSTGAFGDLFNHGFKCFIIVTLLMAVFYALFNLINPGFAADQALLYKEQLINEKQKVPAEIDSAVSAYKKQYILSLVSRAIFGYLIIGAVVTAVLAGLLTRRK